MIFKVHAQICAREGITARIVEIGRRGEVHGPIRADKVIIDRDAHAENVCGREILLRTSASANNIYGQRITIEFYCDVYGEVQYTDEQRVGEKFAFKASTKSGQASILGIEPSGFFGNR